MIVIEAEWNSFVQFTFSVRDEHSQQLVSCPSDISDIKELRICIKVCFNFHKSSF